MALFGLFGGKEGDPSPKDLGLEGQQSTEQAAPGSVINSSEQLVERTLEAQLTNQPLTPDQQETARMLNIVETDVNIDERKMALDALEAAHPERMSGFSEDEVADQIALNRQNQTMEKLQSNEVPVVHVNPEDEASALDAVRQQLGDLEGNVTVIEGGNQGDPMNDTGDVEFVAAPDVALDGNVLLPQVPGEVATEEIKDDAA